MKVCSSRGEEGEHLASATITQDISAKVFFFFVHLMHVSVSPPWQLDGNCVISLKFLKKKKLFVVSVISYFRVASHFVGFKAFHWNITIFYTTTIWSQIIFKNV